jgi:hypothetical protein
MIKHSSPIFQAVLLAFPLCLGVAPATWAMGHPLDPSYAASENPETKDANGQRPRPFYHTAMKKDGPLAERGNCPRPGNCRSSQGSVVMRP